MWTNDCCTGRDGSKRTINGLGNPVVSNTHRHTLRHTKCLAQRENPSHVHQSVSVLSTPLPPLGSFPFSRARAKHYGTTSGADKKHERPAHLKWLPCCGHVIVASKSGSSPTFNVGDDEGTPEVWLPAYGHRYPLRPVTEQARPSKKRLVRNWFANHHIYRLSFRLANSALVTSGCLYGAFVLATVREGKPCQPCTCFVRWEILHMP